MRTEHLTQSELKKRIETRAAHAAMTAKFKAAGELYNAAIAAAQAEYDAAVARIEAQAETA